jgi:hypothetical protein
MGFAFSLIPHGDNMNLLKPILYVVITTIAVLFIVDPIYHYLIGIGLSPLYQVAAGIIILAVMIKYFKVRP